MAGSIQIQYVIKALDRFSSVSNKIEKNIDSLNSKIIISSAKWSKSIGDFGKKMSLRITAPLSLLGFGFIKSASQMENLQVQFTSILGSVDKAKKMVKTLNDFAAKTPFHLMDISNAAKQLLTAGVKLDKIPRALQVIGDISASVNVPIKDMGAILAKSINQGKAMTDDLNQFSARGIPIMKVLGDVLHKNTNDIYLMATQGQITYPILEKALISMTKKNGIANQAMVKLSKTTTGIYSTLTDHIRDTSATIGKIFLPAIKKTEIYIDKLVTSLDNFAKKNPNIVKYVVIFGGILALLPLIAIGVSGVTYAFGILATTIKALNVLMFSNVWIGLLIAIASSAYIIYKNFDSIKLVFINLTKYVAGFFQKFPLLEAIIDIVTKGLSVTVIIIFSIAKMIIETFSMIEIGLVSFGKTMVQWFMKIPKLIDKAISFIAKFAKKIKDNIKSAFDFLFHFFKIVYNKVLKILSPFKSISNYIKKFFSKKYKFPKTKIEIEPHIKKIQSLKSIPMSVAPQIKPNFLNQYTPIINQSSPVMNSSSKVNTKIDGNIYIRAEKGSEITKIINNSDRGVNMQLAY